MQLAGSDKLGRLISIVSIPIVLGPILGPVIGGLILQQLTWHWLFFVNLPIGAVALILMQWKLPKFAPTNTAAKLDVLGITLLALISGLFIYGVTEIRGTDAQTLGLGALIAGAVATLLYLLYAWRQAGHALIPLDLFRSRNFSASFVSLFLAGFATNGPLLLLPIFFQNVRGLDAITAALWLIPQGVGLLLTRSLIGRMTDRFGARLVTLPAIAIIIVGTLPFAFFDATTSVWLIWLVDAEHGIGAAYAVVEITPYSLLGRAGRRWQAPANAGFRQSRSRYGPPPSQRCMVSGVQWKTASAARHGMLLLDERRWCVMSERMCCAGSANALHTDSMGESNC